MHRQSLDEAACTHLYHTFLRLMEQIRNREFTPNIVYRGEEPVEYGVFPYQQFGSEYRSEIFDSVSVMLETYYATKSLLTRIHQKSSDLRRVVQTALERNRKKYNIQKKQLNDTAKKDKFKVYGELINTYGYGLEEGCRSFTALNYYTNEEITIPLDPTLTPAQNSKKYFDKYGKLKRTEEAVTEQITDTESEISHLESISNALDIARSESDLSQIKEELTEYGYIKRHYTNKKGQKAQPKSKPLHYISSDGFDIYVGKNNFQNDELTFKFATGNDWWFHAKKMAGSHVIVCTKDGELPDRTFEEAGRPGSLVLQRTLCSQGRNRLYPEKACEKTCRCETRFRCLLHQLFSHGFSGYFGSERGYGVITIQQKTFLCFLISSRPDTCISASICPEKFFCKHRKFFY